jgi:hypothetical protein
VIYLGFFFLLLLVLKIIVANMLDAYLNLRLSSCIFVVVVVVLTEAWGRVLGGADAPAFASCWIILGGFPKPWAWSSKLLTVFAPFDFP